MNGAGKTETTRTSGGAQIVASPPVVSLPKGGDVIRGIGERFAAIPVTSAGSMAGPIATRKFVIML
jgi:hypothetical protein